MEKISKAEKMFTEMWGLSIDFFAKTFIKGAGFGCDEKFLEKVRNLYREAFIKNDREFSIYARLLSNPMFRSSYKIGSYMGSRMRRKCLNYIREHVNSEERELLEEF